MHGTVQLAHYSGAARSPSTVDNFAASNHAIHGEEGVFAARLSQPNPGPPRR